MKNWKIYLSLLGFVALFSGTFAQGSAKADALLKESQKKFESFKDLKAEFLFTLSNANLKKPIVKKGTASLSGNKYQIVFPDEEMYCNEKLTWLVIPGDEEVTVSCFSDKESLSPGKIFSLYQTGSKTRYDGTDEGMEKVTLFSKDESDLIRTEIWINPKDKLVSRAKMFARNGSVYEYKMTQVTPNVGVSPSIFTFNHAAKAKEGWIVTNLCD